MIFGLDDQLPKFEQAARELVHPLFEKLKAEVRRAVLCRAVSAVRLLNLLCLHAMKRVTYVLLPVAVSCSGPFHEGTQRMGTTPASTRLMGLLAFPTGLKQKR